MSTRITHRRKEPATGAPNRSWAALVDDIAGTDADVEKLVGAYCIKLGCTPKKACALLVRKLASLGSGDGALQLEEVC